MTRDVSQQVDDLIANSNHVSKWVEEQPSESQASYAQTIFAKLLSSASQPRSASGNACVKLCGFVDQSSKSHSQQLRPWAFSKDVVLAMFNFYVEWNESDNHRSMRLVLDVLPHLLTRNPDEQAALTNKKLILDNLISIIIGRSTKPLAKSAIKALDHLLSKDVVTLQDIKTSYVSLRRGDNLDEEDIKIWESFFTELFRWLKVPETASEPSIATWHKWLLAALAEDPSLLESIKNYIFTPLFKADRGEALQFLQRMNNYEAVSSSSDLQLGLSELLQLAALETGKKVGLVEEPALSGNEESTVDSSSILLHEKVLENVLAHPSHEVRSLAFSLLISSPSTTRPYSSTALKLLRKHLATFFADSDAKFRNDVSGKARDMFRRVRGAIFVLKKSIPRAVARAQKKGQSETAASGDASNPILYHTNLISLPEAQLTNCLEYHQDFLHWYLQFLCAELTPTSSYQRHIAALKAVNYILRMEGEKSKSWETADDETLFFDRFDHTWVRALTDLIMNPFEDVRDQSALVIKRIYSDQRYKKFGLMAQYNGADSTGELSELLKRADQLSSRTARADHSDGVGRVCQLLYRFSAGQQQRLELLSKLIDGLEQKLSVAETDLGRAVLEAPLHGNFASLCYTWQVVSELKFSAEELQAVQSLQERLVSNCERVWEAVKSILCDDSPEGHLPQELEAVDGLDTKDVLSYSFRAVHEASNFMRILIQSVRQKSQSDRISPSSDLYARIGNLSFNQLASLRHRGAFSTVALTFATCCQLVKHLDQKQEHGESTLLEQWYKGTMDAIYGQRSTTRRSAGIPAMMTGILSSNASSPSFEQVMDKLMEIASIEARVAETDGSNLPQVHAYNCLKDIFKSSYLTSIGNKSEKYLPQCLELAANGLKSEVWAIRNCGLILLRSLIDCLFGSHESKAAMEAGWDGKANRIAYHRYTTLPSCLLNLLKEGHRMMAPTTSSAGAESVFPALDIIRRAGPPELLRDELQIHVAKYLASPVWHVREIAARTLSSCLLHDKWLDAVKQLASEALLAQDGNAQNHVHGVLLTIKCLVEKLRDVKVDYLHVGMSQLKQFLYEYWPQIRAFTSPDIAAAYLESVNTLRALPNAEYDSFADFEKDVTGRQESALLKTQWAIHKVYVAARASDPFQELRRFLFDGNLGVNGLITALESIPSLWNMSEVSDTELSALADLYIEVCAKIGPAEPRTVALENLAVVLDVLHQDKKLDKLSSSTVAQFWSRLPFGHLNPALANAVIRSSGSIVAILQYQQVVNPSGLENWGYMIHDAGKAEQDFDTRFAAAESLRSFFALVEANCTSEAHITALISLYDCLNDDDDEVREIASAAVKSILGQPLVPIEAANRLLQWLTEHFKDSKSFRNIVASRIVGEAGASGVLSTWSSAENQLSEAIKFDDALFVIEEQNLFIDEVRETDRWIAAFEALPWDGDEPSLRALEDWVASGLSSLRGLATQEDGPLGWASKPQVFAICSRIVRGVAALSRNGPHVEYRAMLHPSIEALQSYPSHASGLLLQPLQDTSRNAHT